ncbi:breast cancer type 1 susceptibility protein [Rana temporaria]|uniref:breast cancer type 1 susceptibility protein n=1 Tax=Rana temporaria TaxID=8407 RepID=UPI001AAC709D|nr:breast cancer type 1 susceptibility protein [Rana temporaria]
MTCETQHVEDIQDVLSVMQKTLECPICLDLMKEPVATRCDHIFCRFCMLQLLGRKKKGRAQCPMCKKEVTKRSLQESPRFKLLIDGLKKIINAFELDSGYKFFPSQDHAKNILMTCNESKKKEEQTVVQSTGYRNRKRTVQRGKCEDHTALLETSIDTLLTRDAGTESCNRLKRKKQETNNVNSKRPLITEFESDYSEDDLFKNVGSLGNDCGKSYPQSELGEDVDEDLKICENTSLKPETDEVVASDLAEYGFSERDLESTRSNLLCMDSTRALKEAASKKRSSIDLADRKAEQSLLGYLDEHNDQAGSIGQSKKHVHDESQILKMSFDNQYDKDDSVPEEMTSTQSSPRCMPNAVPRKRLKRSIQRVNEWIQKTSEFLNATPWDEELLSEVFPEFDDVSDKGSCMSDETEIMTAFCPNTESDAVDKTVNVQDKVFGKVYRREKKSNTMPKITVFASVHVDGVADSRKTNKIPKRSTSGLQPEDFIRRVETTEEISYTNDGVVAKDIVINTEKKDSKYLNNDKSNAQEAKLKTQNKSLKRKSECSLILVKSSGLGMDNKHSLSHLSEININSYPSSNESGHEDNQRNVRRSRRLNVLSKSVVPSLNKKTARTSGKAIKEIKTACGHPVTETVFQVKQMCTTFNESEDQITNILTPNGKVVPFVTDVEIHPAHPECETYDVSIKDCCNMQTEAVGNVLSVEDIDSDADTQHLLKAFKSAKRMSFKLDSVTEIDNKEHSNLVNLSDTKGNLPNQAGIALTVSEEQEQVIHTNQSILSNGNSLGKFNVGGEAIQQDSHIQNLPANLRFDNKNCEENAHMPEKKSMLSAGQLDVSNPVNETTLCKESNRKINSIARKSEVLELCSENDTTTRYPIIAHQSPSVRRVDTRSATTRGENKQVKKDCFQEQNFDEQVTQIPSDNRSQGSVREKLLQHSVSHHSSPLKSSEATSDTPDGILGITDRLGEKHSFCAEVEKSFVFAKEQKVGVSDSTKSPINESQLIKKKKGRAQKLESSEEESSEDEELPCFNNFLFGNASNLAAQKCASSDSSPKQQGGGVLAMFSSYSTSGKTQTSLNFPRETLLGSQESVNLFSSQSNTSDHSTNITTDQELKHNQSQPECHENNSKRNGDTIYSNGQGQTDYEIADNFYEDTCKEQNLDEVSECESEASHTGDSSGLSSQCDVFNTQQRDALRNNLEKIQEEMAALEAKLEQHNAQSPSSEKKQTSTAELNTIRLQETCQKQTDHGANKSPDCVPETDVQPLKSVEQPVDFGIGLRSPTPPPSPSQTKSRMETPEKVRSTFLLLKDLESALTQEESNKLEQSAECSTSTKRPDACKPPSTSLNQATASPRRSLRSTTQSNGAMNKISTNRQRDSTEVKRQQQTNIGGIKRSSSPTFTSPIRTRKGSASSKIPVVPNRRNFSIVASGLSQSELMLVQKFARKTQSILTGEVSESTTHVIIKTDEYLVCERTLKYFLGIAARKWVVSYDWIAQSFREGRILDEYDFEVKGDVINGRNHRGPRRSRLGSDGLLLSDYEICCLGSFKDMSRENLEWMVSLCGASFVKEPQMFKHKEGTTSLVVVQPDGKSDYTAMRKRYRALVVTREWVLDSVSSYKLQTFDNYLV